MQDRKGAGPSIDLDRDAVAMVLDMNAGRIEGEFGRGTPP